MDLDPSASGFARALAALREAGVDFVVVGVGGIDFYSRTQDEIFATGAWRETGASDRASEGCD